jgi:hypothetical protein
MSENEWELVQRALITLLMLPEPFSYMEAREAVSQASDGGWHVSLSTLISDKFVVAETAYRRDLYAKKYRVSDYGKECICPTQD